MTEKAMRATAAMMLALVFGPAAEPGQTIPLRQLGAAEAVLPGKYDIRTMIRPLSDGGMILAVGKHVTRVPASFTNPLLVIDSTSALLGRTTPFGLVLVSALGDTTWIVDVNAAGFLVVEPDGKLGRSIAAPKASDVRAMGNFYGSTTTFVDTKGRLIYQGVFPRVTSVTSTTGDRTEISAPPDTVPIVRADFETRTVDTIAVVSIPTGARSGGLVENGRMTMWMARHPYPMTNAWTVLNDGTVVVAIGSDYHLDWISEKKTTSTPKMPFDWKRIPDDEKVRIIDSLTRMTAVQDSTNEARARASSTNTIITRMSWVKASELPDYYPPIRANVGAVRADPEGNVWVLPTTSAAAPGALVYDIVNREGAVVERVQLPKDCALGAIGAGGVLFLKCTNTGIERRRIVR